LPDGASWNDKDNTCVSSTGIANDPTGKLYRWGGEINTRPTNTIAEQIQHVRLINESLKTQIVNYRSNLHIHIRVPGLRDDLEYCKKLLRYIDRYQQQAFDIVETIPVPNPNVLSGERYEWELKRMKRRKKSHQHKLPPARVKAMLESSTTKEFYENHAHKDAKGNPAWFQCPRAGINIRQMWEETNTIEFRHFPGTTNLQELESCISWSRDFLAAALDDKDLSPREISQCNKYTFPDFEPYEFETEQLYQYTNFDKNTRKVVEERLNNLRKSIDIDDLSISSKEIYEYIK
jgi:hypothetical protein